MPESSRAIGLAVLQLALLPSLSILCGISTPAQSEPQERIIEDKIPKHLPIKIKMKNVLKVKDRKNSKWLRDLEIEVTNTGDKPIYYVRILLYMPDVLSPLGAPYGYTLEYGRHALLENR
ncbi:MAG TPA: hypothetical protein VF544_01810 [Pyrinomonadaceae bacterium]|jgi:hypothetical protein